MLTTRDITRLLSIHLGLDVTPWAARLVREGYLPRRGVAIDEYDAAHLLLAVAGSSDPSRSIEALERLASVPLHSIEYRDFLVGQEGDWVWQRAPQGIHGVTPINVVELMVAALQGEPVIRWMAIDDGGDSAMFEASWGKAIFRVDYTMQERSERTGLQRIAQLLHHDITALANALRSEDFSLRSEDRLQIAHPTSLALH